MGGSTTYVPPLMSQYHGPSCPWELEHAHIAPLYGERQVVQRSIERAGLERRSREHRVQLVFLHLISLSPLNRTDD